MLSSRIKRRRRASECPRILAIRIIEIVQVGKTAAIGLERKHCASAAAAPLIGNSIEGGSRQYQPGVRIRSISAVEGKDVAGACAIAVHAKHGPDGIWAAIFRGSVDAAARIDHRGADWFPASHAEAFQN